VWRSGRRRGEGIIGELAYDPSTGELRGVAGVDVGVGYGRAGGLSATTGRNVPEGWTNGLVANVNARVGPLAAGKSWTLVGTVTEPEFPEDNGEAIGLRKGKTGITANANLGYRHGTSVNVRKICE